MYSLKCDSDSDYHRKKVLGDRMFGHIIVASNRGPVEHRISEGGTLSAVQCGGGVSITLSALSQIVDYTWIACAMGDGDRYAAERAGDDYVVTNINGHKYLMRYVLMSDNIYKNYYSVFCNPFLWFFQHNLLPLYEPDLDNKIWNAWEHGYIPANEAFAETIVAAARWDPAPVIMLHDYHLYLTPGFIRQQLQNAVIHHFTHIPWPEHHRWTQLPKGMCKGILQSLCCCDIVGLQTQRDVRNFLLTCDKHLEEAVVDYRESTVHLNGHDTRVNAYPISVDVSSLSELARSEEVKRYIQKLYPRPERQTIVRVDRVDPSKNIPAGFQAFDMLLTRYPHLVGRVNFLAFLVPSRTNIREYQNYKKYVFTWVTYINEKYGKDQWKPIKVFYENDYHQAIAGMCHYDVLLVNPLADGMNLVAKEGPVVNNRDGVLILSERSGSYEQLKEGALSIDPEDLEKTMQALYSALTMPVDERRERARLLRHRICDEDITQWFSKQLKDLYDIVDGSPLSDTRAGVAAVSR